MAKAKKKPKKKDFFDWWFEQEKTFTSDEVKCLLERIKEFNAGAIDPYLTKHVDKVFNEWANEIEEG